jgi:hypothetical protein
MRALQIRLDQFLDDAYCKGFVPSSRRSTQFGLCAFFFWGGGVVVALHKAHAGHERQLAD